ncbi:HSP90 family heat shock protein, partial [human gut metagenome]
GVSGVAFVLPQAVAPGSGSHRVYTKQMLLGPRVDKILPEWAFFVRAVINADSLTPTASREDLHEDEVLWQVREALGEQLKSWLTTCLSARGSTAQAIIKTHHLALRAVALTDTTVLDLCARGLP